MTKSFTQNSALSVKLCVTKQKKEADFSSDFPTLFSSVVSLWVYQPKTYQPKTTFTLPDY